MIKKMLLISFLVLILAMPVFSMGEKESAAGGDDWMEYDVYYDTSSVQEWMTNPYDIVTPYVEEKFKVKIRDVYWRSGMMTEERLATFIATDTMPHVFMASLDTMLLAENSAMPLQDLIPKYMPNYWNKTLVQWERDACTRQGGKIYWVYKKDHHGMSDEALLDPYDNGHGLSLVVREDILSALGYKFTPIKEIQETCRAEKRAPTLDDWKIEPLPYSNAYEFADFLKEIKEGGFTDMNGNPVFPFTERWGIQILATVFDWGGIWKYYPEDDNCYAALGSKDNKEFLKWWWQMYRDGLVDPDYVGQSPQQLNDKIASGRAAVTINVSDPKTTQDALLAYDDSWYLRPMPLPYNSTKPSEHGYYYLPPPGHRHMFINKDTDMDLTVRILKMWDWLNTDEGIKTLCYGPPSADLTVQSGGKTLFKEPIMSQVLKEERNVPGGLEELGLVGTSAFANTEGDYWSKIGVCSAAPKDTRGIGIGYNIEPRPDVLAMGRRRFCAPSFAYGNATANSDGEAAAAVWGYWNSTFKYNEISRMLNAKNEAEFEEVYKWIMEQNEKEGRFSEAQKYMMDNVFSKRDLSDVGEDDYSIPHEWYW